MKMAVSDKQFKTVTVKMSQSTDKSVLEAARDLGIIDSSLHRWISEYNYF